MLLGPVFGRVGGVLIAFLLPFLDLGIEQSPMLHPTPPAWAHALPGYGPNRVLTDAALTPGFDEMNSLLIALAWLAGLTLAVLLLFRTTMCPAGVHSRPAGTVQHESAPRPQPYETTPTRS